MPLNLTSIPNSFGKGGANIADGDPALAAVLQEHKAGMETLETAVGNKEDKSAKGVASGYASLGTDGKVPGTQLPAATSEVAGVMTTAALDAKADKAKALRTVTAATDTLLAADNEALGRLLVVCTNAVGTTVTVPASVLAVPCFVNIKRAVGAGPVTIAAGAGMTNEQAATPNIAGEGKVATVVIETASTFSLIGPLSA